MVDATNKWMYTGWKNPIYISFVSSNVGSTVDVYRENDSFWSNQGRFGVLGETQFFISGGTRVYPSRYNSVNWKYNEIRINHDMFIKDDFTNDQALGTIIHEFGHAFGLDHDNSNPYSIMCQTGEGRKVQRVQEADNQAIVDKY